MDRLRQGTPAISAYYHTVRGLYFTLELAAAPMGSAPMLRVRKPDNMPVLGEDFVLLVYKARQRGASNRQNLRAGIPTDSPPQEEEDAAQQGHRKRDSPP